MDANPQVIFEQALKRLYLEDANGLWVALRETGIRYDTDVNIVDDYAERMVEGDKFPPIVVFREGDELHVADGFHRIAASEKNDFKNIEAEIHEGTRVDALWYALGANRQHGHRLSSKDKRHAILLALKEFADKSQNQIADQIGVSQQYVAKIKAEVTTSSNLPLPERVIGKDNKSYPAKKPKPTPTSKSTDDEPVPSAPPASKGWVAPEVRDADDVVEGTAAPVEAAGAVESEAQKATVQDVIEGMERQEKTLIKKAMQIHVSENAPDVLKQAWREAKKSEREQFLEWVDRERFKDLPKSDERDVHRLVERLKRALKHYPRGRGYVCMELELKERAA